MWAVKRRILRLSPRFQPLNIWVQCNLVLLSEGQIGEVDGISCLCFGYITWQMILCVCLCVCSYGAVSASLNVCVCVCSPPCVFACVCVWAWGGHGNPLQCSCLENPMDRRAGRLIVHRVTKSLTWLKQLSMHTSWGEYKIYSIKELECEKILTD